VIIHSEDTDYCGFEQGEIDKLIKMEENLGKRVIGQKEPIAADRSSGVTYGISFNFGS
jgi:hypothetical protein